MSLGSITFGPVRTPEEIRQWRDLQSIAQSYIGSADPTARMCNCIGPQGGEKHCPCMLAAEMEKANQMLASGVVIAGRKYRLVLEEGATP